MTHERHYDEEEVAEILQLATAAETSANPLPTSGGGLTLAELQGIGAEVGIAPARIDEAARTVASRRYSEAAKSFLGAPRAVSRTLTIPRALSDDEWTRLVVDLRETFAAEGKTRTDGSLRSWSNGNLQVHVEPDGEGWRVRMRTHKQTVVEFVPVAALMLFMAVVFVMIAIANGLGFGSKSVFLLGMATMFASVGLGPLAYLRASLPRWAAERASQMEGLAERIPRLLKE